MVAPRDRPDHADAVTGEDLDAALEDLQEEAVTEADHSAGAVIGPRAEAIEQGCYPCGRCRSFEDAQE